jgi:predicted dehydrogenase
MEHRFEGAVVCTPANMHIPMAIRLAEAGIHVLIEKPLAVEFDEVELSKLKQSLSPSSGKQATVQGVSAVAYVYRMYPAMRAMKQAIEFGKIGTPVQLVAVAGQSFPFYRPGYRSIYYASHATGGGAIQDAITHLINAGEWLVGPITRLVADAEHCVLDGVEVEDTVHVMARHKSVLASYSLNQHQPVNENTITVIGDRGAVKLDLPSNSWYSCTEPGKPWALEDSSALERDHVFIAQAEMFLRAMDGVESPACSLDEAVQTLRVNRAVLESVRCGEWVTI